MAIFPFWFSNKRILANICWTLTQENTKKGNTDNRNKRQYGSKIRFQKK